VLPGFVAPGLAPGLEVPGLVDPPFGDVPGFWLDPGAVGEVLGVVPGVEVLGLFGLVPGWAVVPGSDPGALPVGGAAVPPVGGAVVLPVGGAPGDACPGVPVPPPAAPAPVPPVPPAPPAPPCANTQVAQPRIRASNVNLLTDICEASLEFSRSRPRHPFAASGGNLHRLCAMVGI
jgi:hypothetical protein